MSRKALTNSLPMLLGSAAVAAAFAFAIPALADIAVTTDLATGITASDATLNGTNGSADATGHSFWVSQNSIDTSSPSIPAGVYSTPDMGAIGAGASFSATLSSITTNGVPSNLPPITPSTTYYYVAWSLVGGTWYPGEVLSFATSDPPPPAPSAATNAATDIAAYSATLNGTNGPVAADNTSFWWGTGSDGPFTASADPGSEFPSGWNHDSGLGAASAGGAFNEPLASLAPNTTYYFVAWSLVDGVWYPGTVLTFTTDSGPLPSVVTNSATGETTTGATLNGTNGPVGADNTSFWWGTTPAGPFVPMSDPSGEFPAGGWTHDTGLGTASAGAPFNEPLTGLASGTTYYFVAWSHANGAWYPGAVLKFITPAPAASCPAGTSQSLVETDPVDSSAFDPTTSGALTAGQSYLLVSSGTWLNGGINAADSAYASFDNWTTYQEGQDITPYFLGPQEFALQVDNAFVNWGAYDASAHTYTYLYMGTGGPVSLGVFDGDSNAGTPDPGWYGDNSGSLSVSIYACMPTTGSLTVNKVAVGGNAAFHFTSDIPGGASFDITTTGNAGSATFANLTPGTYHVTEVNQPRGWTQTDSDCSPVTVTAGGADSCTITDTSNRLLGVIAGTKFEDKDGDGKLKDGDHHRLPGVTITITGPSGYSASAVTDRLGNYRFVGLVAGTYHVSETVPQGWVETYPASGSYTITLAAGKISKNDNFGDFKLGSISGMKYDDANGNGRKNPGETGIAGVTIQLKKGNAIVQTTTTDANGNYSFSGLTAGTYTLAEVVPSGWRQTAHPGPVRVVSGTAALHEDFGNTQKPVVPHGPWPWPLGGRR